MKCSYFSLYEVIQNLNRFPEIHSKLLSMQNRVGMVNSDSQNGGRLMMFHVQCPIARKLSFKFPDVEEYLRASVPFSKVMEMSFLLYPSKSFVSCSFPVKLTFYDSLYYYFNLIQRNIPFIP